MSQIKWSKTAINQQWNYAGNQDYEDGNCYVLEMDDEFHFRVYFKGINSGREKIGEFTSIDAANRFVINHELNRGLAVQP